MISRLARRHCLCFLRFYSSYAQDTDYYKVLDVDPKSDQKAIKAAFYEQSKKLHPDTMPDDAEAPEKFRELVEAYEVLGDPEKRKAFDLRRKPRQTETIWDSQIHDENSQSRPRYGVDPRIMRKIDVDLSEERMKVAWKLYKERWKREEKALRELEEKKMIFRMNLDRKREVYEHLSADEQASIRESMRLFRHPKFTKDPESFWKNLREETKTRVTEDTKSSSNEEHRGDGQKSQTFAKSQQHASYTSNSFQHDRSTHDNVRERIKAEKRESEYFKKDLQMGDDTRAELFDEPLFKKFSGGFKEATSTRRDRILNHWKTMKNAQYYDAKDYELLGAIWGSRKWLFPFILIIMSVVLMEQLNPPEKENIFLRQLREERAKEELKETKKSGS